MSKPAITLEPTKGVISEAAARIYAAYVAAGRVKDDDVESWIKRSIREAVAIARTIDTSIESRDALAIPESIVVRPTADADKKSQTKTKSQARKQKSRTAKKKSRKTKKSKSRNKTKALEELAEDVLMGDDAQEEPRKSNTGDLSNKSTAKKTREPEPKDDSAAAAEEALTKMHRGTSSIQSKPEEAT